VECGSDYQLNQTAGRAFHSERRGHRAESGFKEGLAKGPASGLRMLTFYLSRAGKELTEERRTELEKAKRLLSDRIHGQKNGPSSHGQ
jgi:Protein of unknown function (DUF3175)